MGPGCKNCVCLADILHFRHQALWGSCAQKGQRMAEAVAGCLCSQIIICACDRSLDQDGHVYVCMKLKGKTLEIWLMVGNKNLLITDHAKHWCKLGCVKKRNLNKNKSSNKWVGRSVQCTAKPSCSGLGPATPSPPTAPFHIPVSCLFWLLCSVLFFFCCSYLFFFPKTCR